MVMNYIIVKSDTVASEPSGTDNKGSCLIRIVLPVHHPVRFT